MGWMRFQSILRTNGASHSFSSRRKTFTDAVSERLGSVVRFVRPLNRTFSMLVYLCAKKPLHHLKNCQKCTMPKIVAGKLTWRAVFPCWPAVRYKKSCTLFDKFQMNSTVKLVTDCAGESNNIGEIRAPILRRRREMALVSVLVALWTNNAVWTKWPEWWVINIPGRK